MPRRRASIAALISAGAVGGALRYRASRHRLLQGGGAHFSSISAGPPTRSALMAASSAMLSAITASSGLR